MEGIDSDIIPPTPPTVIPAERRKEGANENIFRLRTENHHLLSQLARLRVDFDSSNLAAASQQGGNESNSSKKEVAEKSEVCFVCLESALCDIFAIRVYYFLWYPLEKSEYKSRRWHRSDFLLTYSFPCRLGSLSSLDNYL